MLKESISKYKFNILLYCSVIVSLFLNFVFLYKRIENPFVMPHEAKGPFLYTLIQCIIFSLPFFFCRKRFGLFILIYLTAIDLLLISNVVYFRFYKNVIPFFSYIQVGNLQELTSVLYSYFRISDFIFLLNTAILYLIYFFFLKKRIQILAGKKRLFIAIILVVFSGLAISSGFIHSKVKKISLEKKFYSRNTNQPHFVSYYGLLSLWGYQIFNYVISDNKPLTDTEFHDIQSFLNYNDHQVIQERENERKNLILIIVESFDTWSTQFNNGIVTPFLNKIASQEDVIFIPRMLVQINHGRSADGQFIYNTGLLPVFNNTVSNLHSKQYYPSIAEILKKEYNSYSSTIMGNKASTWNQQTMNIAYHIDTLISSSNLIIDERIGTWLSDKSAFRQSSEILAKTQQPFYTQIITLSSHDAIDFADYPTHLDFPEDCPTDIKNYLKSIHYVDSALEYFIDLLKKNNLYDNSIIAIAADHNSPYGHEAKKYFPEIMDDIEIQNDIEVFIPLCILNADMQCYNKDGVIGQVDVYPTLLDIMGVTENYWQGIGNSIFSEKAITFAVDKNLKVVGDTLNCSKEDIQHKVDSWKISDLIIRKKYLDLYVKE